MGAQLLLSETRGVIITDLLNCTTASGEPKNQVQQRSVEKQTATKFLPEFLQTQTPIKWHNAIFLTAAHLLAIYAGCWYYIHQNILVNLRMAIWSISISLLYSIGVTAGAHRLWTHRTYKAKKPLRYFYIFLYLGAGMNRLPYWVADHRVHHKYTDTDSDPHNINRGFFFAHMGWLMLRKHPEVIKRCKELDVSDLLSDPVVQFGEKYYWPILALMCFVIPTLAPVLLWNEQDLWYSFICNGIIRYVIVLNMVWTVNSFAHLIGMKPYDNRITPSEQWWVSLITGGEGWHNYHHTFPWDYKASEFGRLNISTKWLQFCARRGWAYDLKEASEDLITSVAASHGDGSREPKKDT